MVMTQNDKNSVTINGERRTFIEDGDEISLYAEARENGYRIGFGLVSAKSFRHSNDGMPAAGLYLTS